MKSTGNYWYEIKKLKKAIEEADAIVIGAGAGLSTSAGFVYNGERFEKHFSEFGKKYGFHDMIITYESHGKRELSEEEKKQLEIAKSMPIVFDEDCPPLIERPIRD